MQKVRCKLTVTNVSEMFHNSVKQQETVSFSAIYSENKEDNSFSKYTPSGNAELVITNYNVFGFFKNGEKYFFDITKS
jgi:hypothetical protein